MIIQQHITEWGIPHHKNSKVSEMIAAAGDSTSFFTDGSEIAAPISPVASSIYKHNNMDMNVYATITWRVSDDV